MKQKNPVAERLERTRVEAGVVTLKDFWRAVNEGLGVSYEAVRNYHFTGNESEPPLKYLRQVAKRFGVRVEWLVSGEEPMRPEARPVTSREGGEPATLWHRAVASKVSGFESWPTCVQETFLFTLWRYIFGLKGAWSELGFESDIERWEVAVDWESVGYLAEHLEGAMLQRGYHSMGRSLDLGTEFTRHMLSAASLLLGSLPRAGAGENVTDVVWRVCGRMTPEMRGSLDPAAVTHHEQIALARAEELAKQREERAASWAGAAR